MTRLPLLLIALLSLAACTPAGTAALAGAGLVSLAYTDKTLTDHAVSGALEEDCSVLHFDNNEPYCQERRPDGQDRDEMAALAASLYCYRTLGGVSCYDRPDYMASNQTRLNFAHDYLPPSVARRRIVEAPVAALPESGTY